MKTWIWEDMSLSNINLELQELIDEGVIKEVISMSLVHIPNPKGLYMYTAILIYK